MTWTRSRALATAILVVGLATTSVAWRRLLVSFETRLRKRRRHIDRATLPRQLSTWRLADMYEAYRIWEVVRPAFDEAGIYLWPLDGSCSYARPDHVLISNGFAYVTPTRGERWATQFLEFNCHNAFTHGGTTSGGLNVVIRIAAMGDNGRRHIEILRKLARGTRSLLTDNHVVPLWDEVEYEDISFIVSPYVGHSMDDCYGFWAKNSVGDIVDMILQALEAIIFVHDCGIVHRDLCKSNYVVQWHPESLATMRVPISRPRVFLTDFEMAHEFSEDVPPEQRLLTGLPIEGYQRPVPPEVVPNKPYDPFKVDVWQLAESFSDFKATIPGIDDVLARMFDSDCSSRISAVRARDDLAEFVHGISPNVLLIPPLVVESPPCVE